MLDLIWLGMRLFYDKAKEDACKYDLRKENMELMQMDVWDGIEKQLEDYFKPSKWSCGSTFIYAKWKGDPNKRIKINRHWLRINRDFWKSGLSVEEYGKVYFKKFFAEHPRVDMQDTRNDFNLYDKNGDTYRVAGDNISRDRFDIYYNSDKTTIYLEEPKE